MDMLKGKHFSITDPKGVNTVIYQVSKTEKESSKEKSVSKQSNMENIDNADTKHSDNKKSE